MKKFIKRIVYFFLIFSALLILLFFLPSTPKTRTSFLFGKIQKDSLLKNIKSPRIIFVGGSNLSFGLDCKLIQDSTQLNPINTGIVAATGLTYMMDNTLKHIKQGDIIVLCPEYVHFFGDFCYGRDELLRTVWDVDRSDIGNLKMPQLLNIIKHIPEYSVSKLMLSEYILATSTEIYNIHSFNKYGDTYVHWSKERMHFIPFKRISRAFNESVIDDINNFQNELAIKNATLLITFPAFQEKSFNNSIVEIKHLEDRLVNENFNILGSPEDFIMPDSLLFDSPYHLSKAGVDKRTKLFIEDFKEFLKSNSLKY